MANALLLLGGSVLPVAGSPPPDVVESTNNNDGRPRSLIRIGTSSSSSAADVVAPPREGNAKDDVVADAGILTSTVLQAVAPTCAAGYVVCDNGYDTTTFATCATSCAGKCCKGNNACFQFTGKVCKDGSCYGKAACWKANIPFVIDSCKGDYACEYAALLDSSLNGCCNTDNACASLDEKVFKRYFSTVSPVRECNICSPCFIQSCFYPCSFVTYYQKYNRQVCWEMEISWRRRQSSRKHTVGAGLHVYR